MYLAGKYTKNVVTQQFVLSFRFFSLSNLVPSQKNTKLCRARGKGQEMEEAYRKRNRGQEQKKAKIISDIHQGVLPRHASGIIVAQSQIHKNDLFYRCLPTHTPPLYTKICTQRSFQSSFTVYLSARAYAYASL